MFFVLSVRNEISNLYKIYFTDISDCHLLPSNYSPYKTKRSLQQATVSSLVSRWETSDLISERPLLNAPCTRTSSAGLRAAANAHPPSNAAKPTLILGITARGLVFIRLKTNIYMILFFFLKVKTEQLRVRGVIELLNGRAILSPRDSVDFQ